MYSKELIKGTLRIVILRLLDKEGRMYGYQMSKAAQELSGGKYRMSEGSLYPLLHKLEDEKLVVTESVQVGGRTRRYYRITEAGRQTAGLQRGEFQNFLLTMQRLLDLQLD